MKVQYPVELNKLVASIIGKRTRFITKLFHSTLSSGEHMTTFTIIPYTGKVRMIDIVTEEDGTIVGIHSIVK